MDRAEVHNRKELAVRRITMATAAAAITLGGLIGGAGAASADPETCVQNVLNHDYTVTPDVQGACRIASSGALEDVLQCEYIMAGEDIASYVARRSCLLAEY
jgi:hypothetical protein